VLRVGNSGGAAEREDLEATSRAGNSGTDAFAALVADSRVGNSDGADLAGGEGGSTLGA
jgi:hypothetical protein